MLQTIFNAQPVFVVNDAPAFVSDFEAEFSLILDQQSSLTMRESRRPYCATVRVGLRYLVTVRDAALRQLQAALRSLNTQPVIVPFWPAIAYWESRAAQRIQGGLMVAWREDWSQFSIYNAGAEPAWPAPTDFVAPALWGYLGRNQPTLLDADSAHWQVDFTESSPARYALAISESVAELPGIPQILTETGAPLLGEAGEPISGE